ncbi:Miniconductance mechanosensitive channel YbdG [termite gut metagenome]|uniref:Miniconductance mechanosensitive channel YbdG n=1 Tax=termite gut metagenome TaxID=433724 RepID=A0A5J4RR60_9ZZZZ
MEENLIVQRIYEILVSWGISPSFADNLDKIVAFALILGVAYLANVICHHIILKLIVKLTQKTKATWDDIIFDPKVMVHLARIVAPILIYILIPVIFSDVPKTLCIIQRICQIAIVISFICFVNALFVAIYQVYTGKEEYRNRPLKGLLQTFQVILFLVGGIFVISILINKSPLMLFTGLGASAAIMMLVFKDSIMGVVSGIQLSANNMLRVGDWIAMPKYNADGIVREVTLNTVKVRNWDNSITTIPPYAFISDSFQNWRGMQESGGRRVKRSINIDMKSVKFCTPEMIVKYCKIHILKEYIEKTEEVIGAYNEKNSIDNSVLVNGRRQTNLGVFRAYLTDFIRNYPDVNHNLMYMIRHLDPTEKGLPVELYFFTNTTNWMLYESVQADVFDHVLAIIPEFDLNVFQDPTGTDFSNLAKTETRYIKNIT